MADDQDVEVQISADFSDFEKQQKKVNVNLKAFARDLADIGRGMTAAITAPLAGIATAAFASSTKATEIFTGFGAEVKSIFGQLGDDLVDSLNIRGVLNSMADGLRSAVSAFTALDQSTKAVIASTALLVAALGPALIALAAMIKAVSALTDVFSTLSLFLSRAGINPIIAVVAVLAAATAAVISFASATANASSPIKGAAQSMEGLKKALEAAVADLKAFDEAADVNRATIARYEAEIKLAEAQLAKFQAKLADPALMEQGETMMGVVTAIDTYKAQISTLQGKIATLLLKVADSVRAEKELTVARSTAAVVMREVEKGEEDLSHQYSLNYDAVQKAEEGTKLYQQALAKLLPFFHQLQPEIDKLNSKLKGAQSGSLFARALDDSARSTRELETRFKALGGGINTTNAELDIQLQKMVQLEEAALRDPSIRNQQFFQEELQRTQGEVDRLTSVWETFKGGVEAFPRLAVQIGNLLLDITNKFAEGVGNAVARAIVYGESLGKALKSLLKEIAAAVISALVAIAARVIITAAIYAAVWTVAKAIEEFGPIIGLVIGTALVGAAIAAVYGAASAAGAAQGGIFEHADVTAIAERGPEIVLNKRNVQQFFGDAGVGIGGNGDIHITLEADGREFAHAVVPYMPGVLRHHGVAV